MKKIDPKIIFKKLERFSYEIGNDGEGGERYMVFPLWVYQKLKEEYD